MSLFTPQQSTDIVRVMLWSVPRSVSTGFLKCMTNVPNSQMWFEPYWMTLMYSTHAKNRGLVVGMLRDQWGAEAGTVATFGSEISGGYWAADKSYSWVKSQLEKPPPENKKVVICKELSNGIYNQFQYIPNGFRHTFLIRHPLKVFKSWEEIENRGVEDDSKCLKLSEKPWLQSDLFFKAEYDLYQHVKEHYEPNPVIIDADDLLADPGRVLKAYCEAVGLPYSDDLLQWKPGRECLDEQWMVAKEQIAFQSLGNAHADTFSTTSFGKPTRIPDRDEVSEDVRHCADISMEHYETMYANRMKF